MVSFEFMASLDTIQDSAFYKGGMIIAKLVDEQNKLWFIRTKGDTEVEWCPTGNFDRDPVYDYKKYTIYPRELKMLMKENKKWRSDKRVRIVKENEYAMYTKENGEEIELETIKLNKVTKMSDVLKMMESCM